ncbi:hypothetical protein RY27_10540, partial [Litorilinea aerophila]
MQGRFAIYRRLLGYLRPYWRQVLIAYTSMLIATGLNLIVPQVIKSAIDNGLTTRQPSALFTAAGLILGIAVLRGMVSFSQRFFGEWLTFRVAYDLRNHFYWRVQNLPLAFHDRAQTGAPMRRGTSDFTEMEALYGVGLVDPTPNLQPVVCPGGGPFLGHARPGPAGVRPRAPAVANARPWW